MLDLTTPSDPALCLLLEDGEKGRQVNKVDHISPSSPLKSPAAGVNMLLKSDQIGESNYYKGFTWWETHEAGYSSAE